MGVEVHYFLVEVDQDGTGTGQYMTSFDFGAFFQYERKKLGKTQAEIADRAGLTQDAYGDIERGARQARADELQKILDAFGLEFRHLDGDKPERLSASQHLDRIAYHTESLRKILK